MEEFYFQAGLFLVVMNVLAFLLMGLDKYKAKKGLWRIPENTLFLPVILGGGIGGILGMKYFRHKTKKPLFYMGFPTLLILWCLGILAYFVYLFVA